MDRRHSHDRQPDRQKNLDAASLLKINAEEDRFLPVEIKVHMLMEQAAMRMRASAIVGEQISKLDDVIRVRALLAIIREKSRDAQGHCESSSDCEDSGSGTDDEARKSGAEESGHDDEASVARHVPPLGPEDREMFTRMAVSAMKTVLFQLSEEGAVDGAKDVFDLYEALVSTDDLALAAAEGFPMLGVDTVMSVKHACYRKLVAARHRFLLRKVGVLLDMNEGLDTLLDLAKDAEVLRDSYADIDLTSPDESEEQTGESLEETDAALSLPSAAAAARAKSADASVVLVSTGTPPVKMMSTLQNTSWNKDAGNDDATEDETDEETPAQERETVAISPSH